MPASPSPAPSGSPQRRLLHVGPHKTGTTTVQSAFHANREALAGHGVHYVGPARQPTEAAKAVAGKIAPGPHRDAALAEWNRLLAEAFASGARSVVLSSEFLCEALDDEVRRIRDDFANEHTRVVITLRPLAKILPSQWQQFVQDGSRNRFEDWVTSVLKNYDRQTPGHFWRRHRYDRLVARWADAIGPERVTVIVSDERDLTQLPREFARLLDLPDDVLVPPRGRANRSLSWEETEVVRHFNIAIKELNKVRESAGRPDLDLTIDRRLAAWNAMKVRPPHPDDHKIQLPDFAVDRIVEMSQAMLEAVTATGVQIVGPVEQLVAPPQRGDASTPLVVDPRAGAQVAASLLSVTIGRAAPTPPAPSVAPAPVSKPGTLRKARRTLNAVRRRLS